MLLLQKKVVEMAHACNVEVEGEIGSVGRNESLEGENAVSLYTEPEDAVEFARLTGVDALAVSIGTVHGVYKKKHLKWILRDWQKSVP